MKKVVIKSVASEHLIKYLEKGGEYLVFGQSQEGNKTPRDGQ